MWDMRLPDKRKNPVLGQCQARRVNCSAGGMRFVPDGLAGEAMVTESDDDGNPKSRCESVQWIWTLSKSSTLDRTELPSIRICESVFLCPGFPGGPSDCSD
jgi:hypothetical protein